MLLFSHFPNTVNSTATSPLRNIRFDQIQATLNACRKELLEEGKRRQQTEASLQEMQDRYELAVMSASDGLWEWDLKTGAVQSSIRRRGMLGYASTAITHIEDWKQLIYPDDREAVLMRVRNHLDALTLFLEGEYRLRHRDGSYRWMHSRGTALRHANGKPYRVVVVDQDIHARKQLEMMLVQAAEGLLSVSGMEFFRALLVSLSSVLGTRDNLICHCLDDPPTRVRALAYYTRGAFFDEPVEYDLDGTSCGAVIRRKDIVYCPTGVCDIWPSEKEYDRDSYLGVPMFDSTGKIFGHFACMDGGPMRHDLPHLAIFKIFSVRAAAELERTLLKQELEHRPDRYANRS